MDNQTNKTFNVKTDTNEIAEIIAYIDADTIADRASQIERALRFNSIVSGVFNSDDNFDFKRCCNKTGALLSTVNVKEYKELQLILGDNRALEIIRRQQLSYISPKWIVTDDKALVNLTIHDPQGYFVFAASKILHMLKPAHSAHSNNWQDTIAADTAWLREKHVLWLAVQNMPIMDLVKSNEIMRRFLAIINPSHAHKQLNFEEFKLFNLHEDINGWREIVSVNIVKCVKHAIRVGRLKTPLTYDDVIKIRNMFKGNSNFAAQRKLRKRSITDTILDELRDVLPEDKEVPINPSLPQSVMEQRYKETSQFTKLITKARERKNGNINKLTTPFSINMGGNK